MKKALLLVSGFLMYSATQAKPFVSGFSEDTVIAATQPAPADTAKFKPDSLRVAELMLPFLEEIPNEPDELIQDRLSCLETTIPLTFNPYVRQFVDYFTIKNRKYTRRMLERENVYFPLFEQYLAKHNMPQELKYLAVVESGLNPKAVSRTKAMGLWQFMGPTANDFRLVQNKYIDERLDPEKSTEAACKFLRQLHNMFGDWQVALAAYNCGPGNVRKAIKRAGGKVDFWAIFPYLPLETRGYVPSFIALTYAMNYAQEHNIQADTLRYAHSTDTLIINEYLDLQRFSEYICVSSEHLMDLNPALKVDYVPGHFKNYPLRVPAHCTEFIAQNRGWLMDTCGRAAATPASLIAMLPEELKPEAKTRSTTKTKQVVHVVKRGDVLGRIADKHDVALADLKKWNKIKGSKIMPGQQLVILKQVHIPVAPTAMPAEKQPQLAAANKAKNTTAPDAKEAKEAKPAVAVKEAAPAKETAITKEATATKEAAAVKEPALAKEAPAAKESTVAKETALAKEAAAAPAKESKEAKEVQAAETATEITSAGLMKKPDNNVYHVQPGDTLFNISRRFEGLTVEQIIKLNNLKSNQIKVGQKLILG